MSATGVGDAARDDAVAAVRALLGPDVEPVLAGAVALPTSSVRGDLAPLRALATWERVAALLAGPAAERALAVKDARPDGAPPPADVEALRALAGDGRTVVLRRLERFDPDAARVAAAFARTFGAAPDVHLYRTPAGASGFGWHYDLEDVFLLQLEGSKEYLLRKNTVDPFPSGDRPPADMRYERERSPTFACRLAEGDWLYLPAGYWHRGTAEGAPSATVAIGLRLRTFLDVFRRLAASVEASLLWRQRAPLFGEAAGPASAVLPTLRQALAELGADLERRLAEPGFAEALVADARGELRTRDGRPEDGDRTQAVK